MAGFTNPLYEADSGNVYFARIEENTIILAIYGAPPAGPATEQMTVLMSKSQRSFGVHARGLSMKRTVGTEAPAGNTFGYVTDTAVYKFAAIGTPDVYNDNAHYPKDTVVSLKGGNWKVVGRVSEAVN